MEQNIEKYEKIRYLKKFGKNYEYWKIIFFYFIWINNNLKDYNEIKDTIQKINNETDDEKYAHIVKIFNAFDELNAFDEASNDQKFDFIDELDGVIHIDKTIKVSELIPKVEFITLNNECIGSLIFFLSNKISNINFIKNKNLKNNKKIFDHFAIILIFYIWYSKPINYLHLLKIIINLTNNVIKQYIIDVIEKFERFGLNNNNNEQFGFTSEEFGFNNNEKFGFNNKINEKFGFNNNEQFGFTEKTYKRYQTTS